MAYDRFMIGPINTGLETDLRAFLVPEDAFTKLKNAYVFRGRVRKRFGSLYSGYGAAAGFEQLNSRLRTRVLVPHTVPGGAGVGITDGAGAATGTIVTPPFVASTLGDKFEIGGQVFTVTSLGAAGVPIAMTSVGGAGTGTIITSGAGVGTFAFLGCAITTQIYYYQAATVATTNGAGAAFGVVPGTHFKLGQMFSIGTELFIVNIDAAGNKIMLTNGPATTHTFNITNGYFDIVGSAQLNTAIYFYPLDPVMALTQHESGPVNYQPSFAFDTQFAYQYSAGAWLRSGIHSYTSSDSQFFWCHNWRGPNANDAVLFATNFKINEMSYYDGTTWTAGWVPKYGLAANDNILTAKIIISFKGCLLLLNTIEGAVAGPGTTFVNRCRFSAYDNPVGAGTFYVPNTVGAIGGGYTDCPTKEAIVSAQYIRDRLIVFFEQSTWELAYTGNYVLPFEWQKLNMELGAQSTYSAVPFDKAILTVGKTGIHSCNGVNVDRIDQKIPDKVFEIRNTNDGAVRVAGIRDYFTEMVYWSIPFGSGRYASTYPNTVLVYNYANGSWALNDDTITAFGYFEQQTDRTWANSPEKWQSAGFTWTSGVISGQFRQIFAGNQQGFVFIISPDTYSNASVMSITNITQTLPAATRLTLINHNLIDGDLVYVEKCHGSTEFNDIVFNINVIDANTIALLNPIVNLTHVYTGGGVVKRVSCIDIETKQFNPYTKQGKNVYLAKVDFYVKRTANGQILVDYYPSSTQITSIGAGAWEGSLLGTGILETSPSYYTDPDTGLKVYLNEMEQFQERLWHPLYFQADGDCIQLRLYQDFYHINLTPDIAFEDFELDAMVLYTMSISRLQ